MTLEQQIINYLRTCSKGRVTITHGMAANIIEMVLQPGRCKAVLHKYNYITGHYDVMQTMLTTADKMESVLKEALLHKPVEQCYRYDLYNEYNELQGYIYSLSISLF